MEVRDSTKRKQNRRFLTTQSEGVISICNDRDSGLARLEEVSPRSRTENMRLLLARATCFRTMICEGLKRNEKWAGEGGVYSPN